MEYFIIRIVLPEAIMIGASRVNRIVNPGFLGVFDYLFTALSISYLFWTFSHHVRIFIDDRYWRLKVGELQITENLTINPDDREVEMFGRDLDNEVNEQKVGDISMLSNAQDVSTASLKDTAKTD